MKKMIASSITKKDALSTIVENEYNRVSFIDWNKYPKKELAFATTINRTAAQMMNILSLSDETLQARKLIAKANTD